SQAGFDVYIVPPNTNPQDVIDGKAAYYWDPDTEKSCSRKSMLSFGHKCTVENGSYLLVNNPASVLGGNNQNIHITITELNTRPNYDMRWDPSVQTMSQQEYNHIWTLFHSQ